MSEALWAQRAAPDGGSPATVIWTATPASLAELPALRGRLRARLADGAGAGAEEVEWLVLAFEELASNGLRHGRSPVHVVVSYTGRGWLLDVGDAAPERPPTPAIGRDPATGGLGLYMVARLGAAHGWLLDGDRKRVWVRIDYAAADSAVPRVPQPRGSSEQPAPCD
jgi:Histidine kinase-like ATPase domain